MEIGEVWAYREKQGAPLLEVAVRGTREAYPPRAKIEFLDDVFAGDTQWVPAGRLKCLWADRQALLEGEARWEDLCAEGRPDSAERDAVQMVFWELAPEVIGLHSNGVMGIGEIYDLEQMLQLLGWDRAELVESPGAMSEEGILRVRWSLTRRIARELAQKLPGRAFRLVARERADMQKWIDGRVELVLDHAPWTDEGEARAEAEAIFEKSFAHAEIIATWVGAEEEIRHREHAALVRRFDRLSRLARTAAPLLRDRRTKSANKLADEIEEVAVLSGRSGGGEGDPLRH